MSIQTSNPSQAATAARRHPVVRSAQVVERTPDGRRVLELVLVEGIDRVPPGVLVQLVEHDCGIATVQPQGDYLIVEAV